MVSWELIFAIIPGIILFLYGIEQFSHEVQVAAGEYFRGLIQRLTRTPVRGTIVGTLVTALVQSSTATTVITVGLVNAGVISFTASLGIIFGANFGTTVTSILVALNLTAFAPVLILAGFLISIIGGKYKVFGRPVFYFGLVFFSLSMISAAMAPYRTDPQLVELVGMMDSVFLQVAFGFIITTIFQSSSVTTGLVVVMTQNGVITTDIAIPILLGANLGTPTTSLLVASRMNTSAKRAAVAHFLFNFLGVLIFLPILGPFTWFIESLGGAPALQVANAHFIFNLTCCIIFLILVHPFEKLVRTLVRGSEDDIVFTPKYLTPPLPEQPADAFRRIEMEITHLYTISGRLIAEVRRMLNGDAKNTRQVSQLQRYSDYLDGQISDAALQVSKQPLPEHDAALIAGLVRLSKLGQVLSEQAGELCEEIHQLEEKGIILSAESKEAILSSLIPCEKNLEMLVASFPDINGPVNESMRTQDDILRDIITTQYGQYIERFAASKSPAGSTFSRVLFNIEGIAATIREIRKSARRLPREGSRE
ncbi:MAG: Na/Pi cotransporter family protein [Methanoregulaceae archaeon]|nr:Na/Pi cotransporter family protein [Methanoregulaceae archaeon]